MPAVDDTTVLSNNVVYLILCHDWLQAADLELRRKSANPAELHHRHKPIAIPCKEKLVLLITYGVLMEESAPTKSHMLDPQTANRQNPSLKMNSIYGV